jgi:hypothetical protein
MGAVLLASEPLRAQQVTCPYPNLAQNFDVDPPKGSGFVGYVGVPFSRQITVKGGPGKYFWQLTQSSYPAGVMKMRYLGTRPENSDTNYFEAMPTMPVDLWSMSICIYPEPPMNCLGTCGTYHFRVVSPPDAGTATADGSAPADGPARPDAPAPVDVPATSGSDGSVDAPMDPVDAPVADGRPDTPPDTSMCLMVKEKCASSGECCTGLRCALPTGTTGGTVCCADEKTACMSDGDCCSMLTCKAGVCTQCQGTIGGKCASDAECCSLLRCEQGACSPCQRGGESCSSVACCSQFRCSLPTLVCEPRCSTRGEACGDGCCSGLECRAPENKCQPPCSRAGEPCENGCCAGYACTATRSDRVPVCRNCSGNGGRCDFPTDCCDGFECDKSRCVPKAADACDCRIGGRTRSGANLPLVALGSLAAGLMMLVRRHRRRTSI